MKNSSPDRLSFLKNWAVNLIPQERRILTDVLLLLLVRQHLKGGKLGDMRLAKTGSSAMYLAKQKDGQVTWPVSGLRSLSTDEQQLLRMSKL